uniref:Uncharacterized protein n=1 Tax=Meloidogyne incognita TaxID=6306 RepID=A0A914LEF6_MELIC
MPKQQQKMPNNNALAEKHQIHIDKIHQDYSEKIKEMKETYQNLFDKYKEQQKEENNNFKRKLKEEKEQQINSIQKSHENVLKRYKNDLFSCRKELKETQDNSTKDIVEVNKNGSEKACSSTAGTNVNASTQDIGEVNKNGGDKACCSKNVTTVDASTKPDKKKRKRYGPNPGKKNRKKIALKKQQEGGNKANKKDGQAKK